VNAPGLPTSEKLVDDAKLAGMATIQQSEKEVPYEDRQEVAQKLGLAAEAPFTFVKLTAKMPNFKQGSSRLLSFAKKVSNNIYQVLKKRCL